MEDVRGDSRYDVVDHLDSQLRSTGNQIDLLTADLGVALECKGDLAHPPFDPPWPYFGIDR